MSRILPHLVLAAFLSSAIHPAAGAQSVPTSCPAPPAVLSSTQPNIFSEQQEQWLGDAMADMLERDMLLVSPTSLWASSSPHPRLRRWTCGTAGCSTRTPMAASSCARSSTIRHHIFRQPL